MMGCELNWVIFLHFNTTRLDSLPTIKTVWLFFIACGIGQKNVLKGSLD